MISSCGWMNWINSFFSELEIFEDREHHVNYKEMLCNKIKNFLERPSEKTSEEVYESFFVAYWLGKVGDNPFLDLIKKVRQYEKTSGSLLPNHRDHFSHAVFVFITGLVVYWNSKRYRDCFDYYIQKTKYADLYTTKHEEFFYRWGIASLFHDTAYPIEISIKQLNDYYKFTLSYGQELSSNNVVSIPGFCKYKNCIAQSINPIYEDELKQKYGDLNYLLESDCCRLLARDIGNDFCLDKEQLFSEIYKYDNGISSGIVDHGFLGSLICLKWYSSLIDKTGWNPAYFHYPILDAASAIFLHNAFKHLLQKKFSVPPMRVSQKPISYLLILVDNLQVWKRESFSGAYQQNNDVSDVKIDFGNESIFAEFIVKDDVDLNCNALKNEIKSILELSDLFVEFDISVSKEEK